MNPTPFELRERLWYKREDRYTDGPVNGSKLRACQHLIGRAKISGYTTVVSASSILSPQSAMAAVTARGFGMDAEVIIGATTVESARRKPAIRIAAEYGARFTTVPVAYNPYLQKRAKALAQERGAYLLNYGITTPADADRHEVRGFLASGASALVNLPDEVRTLVVPFGSGNTAAGILYGLGQDRRRVERVVLVGIGPSRRQWLTDRLAYVGTHEMRLPHIDYIDLHGSGYARYQDRMPEERDGITFHPTYEGKVVRYLDEEAPNWWTRRNSSVCLWVVGGPIGGKK